MAPKVRKGAADAIEQYVKTGRQEIPQTCTKRWKGILPGRHPSGGVRKQPILGVIYLKDTVKPGMVERF